MIWIIIAIALMVISFIANVMLTPECDHNWEDREEGISTCSKCKRKTSQRSYLRYNSGR